MSDHDARFLGREFQVRFIGPTQVSGCHSRQTVVTTGREQVGEQHVNIFIQVNTQARGVDRHWTCPVAGSNRFPDQLSGM